MHSALQFYIPVHLYEDSAKDKSVGIFKTQTTLAASYRAGIHDVTVRAIPVIRGSYSASSYVVIMNERNFQILRRILPFIIINQKFITRRLFDLEFSPLHYFS